MQFKIILDLGPPKKDENMSKGQISSFYLLRVLCFNIIFYDNYHYLVNHNVVSRKALTALGLLKFLLFTNAPNTT